MPRISSAGMCGTGNSPSTFSITAFKVREKYEAGVHLLQSGYVLAAIQQFQEASFFDAEDALPIVALAECYIFLCDLRSAIRCYRRALWSLRKQVQRRRQQPSRSGRVSPLISAEADAVVLISPAPPPPLAPSSQPEDVPAPEAEAAVEAPTFPLPPSRPHTAQFPPPTAFLSGQALSAMAEGRAVSMGPQAGATAEVAMQPVAEELSTKLSRSLSISSPAAAEAAPFREGDDNEAAGASSSPSSHVRAADSDAPRELTAAEVRGRLAGVLDALGLSLFQVGSVEQALRCTTEALELLAASDAEEGESGVQAAGLSLFTKQPGPYLSEPTIALHRAVFLMALQREEEAEVLLSTHYETFASFRAQSAPLLIQLYCNRQAFRKARLLLETQEEGPQRAASRGERATSANSRPIAPHDDEEAGDHSSSDVPTPAIEEDRAIERASARPESTRARAPSLSTPPSLTVAKFIFTELYARYRSAALASTDEDSVTRCLDVYPNDVDLLFRRAQLRIAAGDLKRSIKDLFSCVQDTNGEHKAAIEAMTTVLFTIGSSLDGESEVQNAVTYYSESLKWRPDNLLVLLARGDCYTKMESFEEALADYHAILNYAPQHREAQGRIATLHDLWGRKFFAADDAAQAETEFTNAIKTDSTNPEFYYHRALCRLKLNHGQYALRDVLSCKELNPSAPHLRAFIARYMEPMQQPTNAEEATAADGAEWAIGGSRRRHAAHRLYPPADHTGQGPTSIGNAAARWYGAHTPPPAPPADGHRRRGVSRTTRGRSDDNAASEPPSRTSSVLLLPPLATRSMSRSADAEGFVRGCQTTLHRRRGETLSLTK